MVTSENKSIHLNNSLHFKRFQSHSSQDKTITAVLGTTPFNLIYLYPLPLCTSLKNILFYFETQSKANESVQEFKKSIK